jgi:hypothetical protein
LLLLQSEATKRTYIEMKLNSTIQEIEQELKANATFMSLAQGNCEGSSVSIEAEGLHFLLYKNANGAVSSYLSEQANGIEKPALDKIVVFTKNLEVAANLFVV